MKLTIPVAVTAGVLTSIALGPALEAPGTTHVAVAAASSSQCRLDPAYLPRTPDAAEAWFEICYAHRTSGGHGD